ncbi:hypothetical protein ACGF0J_21700 [Nonomuraea sp. NPDC047897]|uniref:hypothetical protein n=1 Tax=Nonomuraea sp. NPDC047897 TaxID=3364346 RepID=UPI00371F2EBF
MVLPHYDRGEISPEQIRHRLDDGWSMFDFGSRRIEVRRDDLHAIRAARELAQALAGQAAMWDKDLAALEDALTPAEDSAPHDAPGPLQDPTVAPEPTNEPFGGDDPELDAAVARVAELAEAQRQPEEEGDL